MNYTEFNFYRVALIFKIKKIKLDYKTSLRIIFHKGSVVKKPKACINVKHYPCFQET